MKRERIARHAADCVSRLTRMSPRSENPDLWHPAGDRQAVIYYLDYNSAGIDLITESRQLSFSTASDIFLPSVASI